MKIETRKRKEKIYKIEVQMTELIQRIEGYEANIKILQSKIRGLQRHKIAMKKIVISNRQQKVLGLRNNKYSFKEIASILKISPTTARKDWDYVTCKNEKKHGQRCPCGL